MDNRKEEHEKALLLLIDRYNEEREKDRLYFLKFKKNNPDSGLNKEPFLTFYKVFESKASQIEITDFLYHFGLIRLLNTFHYSHHAESLIHDFEKLNIPVPHFVLECQKEVVFREDGIKSFFENEKFKWSETKREDFLLDIQKEAKFHSFGIKSKREYLEKKFEETIQEVRKVESEIQRRFGYFVDGFFDGDNFKVSASDLNEYFYHSEIASGGCGSYFEVWKALDRFINKKHEMFALRNFLSVQKEEIGLESIWMTKPKKSIEEILEKGSGLGFWNENFQLQTKRKGLGGHGKSFLSNLYHALIGNSIKSEIHHKEIGRILCRFFKVKVGNSKEPFKSFQGGNPKQMEEINSIFKIY